MRIARWFPRGVFGPDAVRPRKRAAEPAEWSLVASLDLETQALLDTIDAALEYAERAGGKPDDEVDWGPRYPGDEFGPLR